MRTHPALLLALVLLWTTPACITDSGGRAHPEAIAKKSLEGIAGSVDVAMKVYVAYAVEKKLTVEQQAPVKKAHDSYRLVMQSAVETIRALRDKPVAGGYEKAAEAASVASGDLLHLIYSKVPNEP